MSERFAVVLMGVLLAGCVADGPPQGASPTPTETSSPPFLFRSPAFEPTKPIPREYSCDAAVGVPGQSGASPPLRFQNVPFNASRLALIMEDPDAPRGTFVHWTFWNLDRNRTELPRSADVKSGGGREGKAYGGPCPPVGTHRYFFYAFATKGALDLEEGASADQLRAALRGRVAAQDSFYGTYTRPNVG